MADVTKTEGGVEGFTPDDYCYVGDPQVVGTWKLRISAEPGGDPDPTIVGQAAAALGPDGFRGQPVDIPADARPAAVACVRDAWMAANPDKMPTDMPPGIHRSAELGDTFSIELDAEVEVRDATKREIDVRLLPWDFPIDTLQGREQFVRGAFDDVNPTSVLLMGLEHEAFMGVGQSGQPKLVRRPVGKSIALDNRPDGQHATFRVAKTQAGDELLELAAEKIVRGVSVEITETVGGTTIENAKGRRTLFRRKVGLPGVSLTTRPAYGEQAAVLAVRSQQSEGEQPVAEPQPAETTAAPPNVTVAIGAEAFAPLTEAITRSNADLAEQTTAKIEAIEERMRTQITMPAPQKVALPPVYLWLKGQAYRMSGERMPEELATLYRTIDDVTAADNPGLVPDAYLNDLAGKLSAARPFLETTSKVNAPATGMNVVVPKISQHTQTGVQSTEKTEVASRALQTDTDTFAAITIAGAVDVSYQFIKRGDPAAVQIVFDDMAANYAQDAETQAITSLLDADVNSGGTLDPTAITMSDLLTNAAAAGLAPNTIWASTAGFGALLDASNGSTGLPLYPQLQFPADTFGGVAGSVRGLRVVWVPKLTTVDYIVGPSTGFRWAEDGTYRLEADNPALAGRDIGIVGFLFPMPRAAEAFTTYSLGA